MIKLSLLHKFLASAVLALVAPVVFAHTGLVASSPATDSQLDVSPETLELTFAADLRLMRLQLFDGNGETLEIGFKPSPAAAKHFSAALPALPAGTYRADWVAMGLDGHKMSGSVSFAVGAAAEQSATSDHNHHAAGH